MMAALFTRLCYALIASVFAINAWAMPPAPSFSEAQFCLHNSSVSHNLRLQIATTDEQLAYGLMFRKKLNPYDGMLFRFPYERIVMMWMKNTPLALDMVFLDSKGKIVEIRRDAVPYSESIITTHQPVSSVIELEAGRAKQLSATIGTILSDGACKRF